MCIPYTLKIRSGCEGGGKGALIQEDKSATLATNNDQYLFQPVTLEPGIAAREGGHIYEGVSGTLRAEAGDNRMAVAYAAGFCPEQSAKTRGVGYEEEIAPTLRAGVTPGVCVKTYDARGNGDGDKVSTLTGDHENRITDYTSVVVEPKPVYCLQGNGIDRAFFNQGKNAQYDPQYYADGTVPTLVARGPSAVVIRYIVRRLTPTECARLQGFADRWGDIEEKETFTPEEFQFWHEVRNTHATVIGGKEAKEYTESQMLTWYNRLHTDSAEYKMWGNGIALPPALYVLQGMAEAFEREEVEDDWML